jgi:hypothetical protein
MPDVEVDGGGNAYAAIELNTRVNVDAWVYVHSSAVPR